MYYGVLITHVGWGNDETAHLVTSREDKVRELLDHALQLSDMVHLQSFMTAEEARKFAYAFTDEELADIMRGGRFTPARGSYPYTDSEQVLHMAIHLGIPVDDDLRETVQNHIEGISSMEDYPLNELEGMYDGVIAFAQAPVTDAAVADARERVLSRAKTIHAIAEATRTAAGPDVDPFNEETMALLAHVDNLLKG